MTPTDGARPGDRARASGGAFLTRRRDEAQPDTWHGSPSPATIDAIGADHRAGVIEAPGAPTPLGTTLRTHALVLARYGADERTLERLTRTGERPARWALDAAQTMAARKLTGRAMTARGTRPDYDDRTADVIASAIEHERDPAAAFRYAAPYLNEPQGGRRVLEALRRRHPIAADALNEASDALTFHLDHTTDVMTDTTRRKIGRRTMRRYDARLEAFAATLETIATNTARAHAERNQPQQPKQDGTPEIDLDGRAVAGPIQWQDVVLAPIRLERPHVGRTGRSHRPAAAGPIVRDLSRQITDPERRVFGARARYRSALVVLDLSGSMSYTEDDLDAILDAARGSTVVGYSGGANPNRPNVWLLAHQMRRVATLPTVPGGNRCDGPALTFAVRRFRRAGAPVVWVSDGVVTGVGDACSAGLFEDMRRRLHYHGVTQVETIEAAHEVLERMAHGYKPAPEIVAVGD